MKNILTILLLFLSILTYGQEIYSKVKIDLTQNNIKKLSELGVETDHGVIVKNKYIINDYRLQDINLIRDAGFNVDIIIEDVSSYYANQSSDSGSYHEHLHGHHSNNNVWRDTECNDNQSLNKIFDYDTPSNYTFGSMGGYLTYDELLVVLDSMYAKYPHLITAKAPISTINSIEGRPLLYLKISDNPTEEEDEPEVLYNALHHAREANSLSQLVFYMWYLLENYETDEEIKYIVDNTQLFFIPCVNPDGYVYNESIRPNGGGMWRKNRRLNDNGTYGVDLNRNYGYEWGIDNTGSSPNPGSEVYRGTAPFSEPELQAVKEFCENHEFKITLNYHSYGNLLIHPWGYSDTVTADHETFRAIGSEMIKENNYTFGTGSETVGYVVNGDSDDWMYGAEGIISMTPEIGPGEWGFWPPSYAIDSLNKTTMYTNIIAAKSILSNIVINEKDENNNLSSLENTLVLYANNIGLTDGSADITISEITNNTDFTTYNNQISLESITSDTFSLDFNIENETNEFLQFLVELDNNGLTTRDTITKSYNYQHINSGSETIFQDSFDDTDNWTLGTNQWGLSTTEYFSPPSSMTDSPEGPYSNNTENILDLSDPIDLTEVDEYAVLKFKAKWGIEKSYDYAQVLISTDQINYYPQCGIYSVIGNGNQDYEKPLYDGQSEWIQEEINLTEYLGQVVYLRFSLNTDQYETEDGIYIDDLEVLTHKEGVGVHAAERSKILLTPNPTSDYINIDLGDVKADQLTITIYNIHGTKMYESSINQFKMINVSNYSSGVYFATIKSNRKVLNRIKFIKI